MLQERIKEGWTVFQGSHPSLPLQALLSERSTTLHPYFVDLRERKQVIEYRKEDQVISVETGILLSELAALLASNGQFLPCFAREDLSLLEVINSAQTGYFEHSYGLRVLVLGLEVILSGGEKIKTGGKVVKNVTGYDLTKLFLGARGTLGLPTMAHLRVYALPEKTAMFLARGQNFDALLTLSNDLIKTGLPLTGLELVLGSENGLADNFLLICLGEHSDVMSELVPLIEEHGAQVNAVVTRLELDQHTGFMQSLESEFELDLSLLTLSLSRSQCQKLYAVLKSSLNFKLHFRPGIGKLRLKFQSYKDLLSAVEILRRSLSAIVSDALDITYSDQEFELRVERLPKADGELDKIKRTLKNKFDPTNSMNPLAKL